MIEFFVRGVPAPKGSAIARPGKRLGPPCAKCGESKRGRPFVAPASKTTAPWAKLITGAALASLQRQGKAKGAVKISLVFHMPRPKKHFLKSGMRTDAPHWHEIRPDVDKLERTVLDALTDYVMEDDCKVVKLVGEKVYANGGCQEHPTGKCGVEIVIKEVHNEVHGLQMELGQ